MTKTAQAKRETALVTHYRKLNPEQKKGALTLLRSLANPPESVKDNGTKPQAITLESPALVTPIFLDNGRESERLHPHATIEDALYAVQMLFGIIEDASPDNDRIAMTCQMGSTKLQAIADYIAKASFRTDRKIPHIKRDPEPAAA